MPYIFVTPPPPPPLPQSLFGLFVFGVVGGEGVGVGGVVYTLILFVVAKSAHDLLTKQSGVSPFLIILITINPLIFFSFFSSSLFSLLLPLPSLSLSFLFL